MKKNFVSATVEYSTLEHSVPSPYLRKTISLSAKPEVAELKVSGLGFYRLFVNGKDMPRGRYAASSLALPQLKTGAIHVTVGCKIGLIVIAR